MQLMKDMDICYHFVREFLKDRFIRIIFVKTTENTVGLITKNVCGATPTL